jgi:hypothetical protein
MKQEPSAILPILSRLEADEASDGKVHVGAADARLDLSQRQGAVGLVWNDTRVNTTNLGNTALLVVMDVGFTA